MNISENLETKITIIMEIAYNKRCIEDLLLYIIILVEKRARVNSVLFFCLEELMMKNTLMITLLIIGLILGYSIESNITVESVNSFELIVKE